MQNTFEQDYEAIQAHELEIAKQIALKFVSARMRTTHEVMEHLQKKGCTREQVRAAVLFLKEYQYLDDALYCRAWIHDCIQFHPCGRQKMAAELRKKISDSRLIAESLDAYRQAVGWNQFPNILPIEPPIVTGLDNVQVSWVQNFSATGYVWTLYLDKAHTQRYMTLTFDANGHLISIDIANNNNAPAKLPALYEGEEDEKIHFAEYYSFTINGLQSGTTYYYTRQSLNGEDVIDEENGTFTTQSSTTNLDNINTAPSPIKFISNGNILLKHGGKTYTIHGQEVKM